MVMVDPPGQSEENAPRRKTIPSIAEQSAGVPIR
jgi:hypothetical protein